MHLPSFHAQSLPTDSGRPSRYSPARLCACSIRSSIVDFQKARKLSSCENNTKRDALKLNHRVLFPSIVHIRKFSCVHKTCYMLQMLPAVISIIPENLLRRIKISCRTTNRRTDFLSPGGGHLNPFRHRMSSQQQLYFCQVLGLDTYIMTLRLQVRGGSHLCNKQITSVIKNLW